MTDAEYEAETIRCALAGDHQAGRDALQLCREGLEHGNLSRALAEYLAERLRLIDQALAQAEMLREHWKPSLVKSNRDAEIAEALCINRPAKKPADALPAWQTPLAAAGIYLRRHRVIAARSHEAMSEVRNALEGKTLDRREAQRILKMHGSMWKVKDRHLLHLAGPSAREILSKFLPLARKP